MATEYDLFAPGGEAGFSLRSSPILHVYDSLGISARAFVLARLDQAHAAGRSLRGTGGVSFFFGLWRNNILLERPISLCFWRLGRGWQRTAAICDATRGNVGRIAQDITSFPK